MEAVLIFTLGSAALGYAIWRWKKTPPENPEDDWVEVDPVSFRKATNESRARTPENLRPDIPNPKITGSPWLQSTIEPDHNIKPLT